MNAAQLPEQYATRPGTPMVGPYSTNQMDDFTKHWAAVKPSRRA